MECPQPEYFFPSGPFYVIGSQNIYRHSELGRGINASGETLINRRTVEDLLARGVVYTSLNDFDKRTDFNQALAAPYIKPKWLREMED